MTFGFAWQRKLERICSSVFGSSDPNLPTSLHPVKLLERSAHIADVPKGPLHAMQSCLKTRLVYPYPPSQCMQDSLTEIQAAKA